MAQAEALEKVLHRHGMDLDAVVQLDVDENALAARVEQRAAESGDAVRDDDTVDALKKRLVVYREQTAPLVDHYREVGNLVTIDGMQSIDEVERAINEALSSARDRRVSAAG